MGAPAARGRTRRLFSRPPYPTAGQKRAGVAGRPNDRQNGRNAPVGQENGPCCGSDGRMLAGGRVARRPVAAPGPLCPERPHPQPQPGGAGRGVDAEWGWTVPVLVDEPATSLLATVGCSRRSSLGLDRGPGHSAARGWREARKRGLRHRRQQAGRTMPAGTPSLLPVELAICRGLGVDLGLTGFGKWGIGALLGCRQWWRRSGRAPTAPANPVSRQRRCMDLRRASRPVRRRDGVGRRQTTSWLASCGHGLHRSTVRGELCELDRGQATRQELANWLNDRLGAAFEATLPVSQRQRSRR